MLTNLTFKNNNPAGIQRHFDEYPNAFVVCANLEHENFKNITNIDPNDIIIFINQIEPGIYDTGFTFHYEIDDFTDCKCIDKYYNLFMGEDGTPKRIGLGEWDWDNKSLYGVADNINQVKEYFAPAINNPNVNFVISVTEINKSTEPKEGGWRWHKWGEYIGAQNPQCEYLADEPNIDKVLVFHGYYVEKKTE